jgi:AAA domain
VSAPIEDQQATLSAFMAEMFPEPVATSSATTLIRNPRLTDLQVTDAARAAKNGAAISALLAGDIAGYPSPSEAVAGLLYHLAFWTQKDTGQMRRIFEGSGLRALWADKWDRLGDSEISKAIAGVPETYSPPVPVFKRGPGVASSAAGPPVASAGQETAEQPERPFGIPVREWAAQVPEVVEWVWGGYIARGDLVELDGAAKRSGKSTLIWHLVKAMETGADYLGGATARGHVVVLSEMAGSSLREQLEAAGIIDADNLTLVLYNEWSGEPWESIADRAIAACVEHSAVLLVIDTLPKWAKIRENQGNSEGEWLARMQALEPLHGSQTAVALLCHDRKSGGAVAESGAGSTARVGAMDTVLRLSRIDGGDNSRNRKLEALGRHPDSPEQQIISLTPDGYITLGTEPAAVKQWVGNEVREIMENGEPWTARQLRTSTDGSEGTVRRALEWLIDHDLVRKTPGATRTATATYRLGQAEQ